jgi:hypothetical protein
MQLAHRSVALFFLVLLFALPAWAQQQTEPKSVVAYANGTGTIKLGDEQFKVTAVVAKLFEDGKVEISIVSDITIFMSGTWTRSADSANVLKLKITAGAAGSGVDASGDLSLRENGQAEQKGIDSVSLQGESKTTHQVVALDFKAK